VNKESIKRANPKALLRFWTQGGQRKYQKRKPEGTTSVLEERLFENS